MNKRQRTEVSLAPRWFRMSDALIQCWLDFLDTKSIWRLHIAWPRDTLRNVRRLCFELGVREGTIAECIAQSHRLQHLEFHACAFPSIHTLRPALERGTLRRLHLCDVGHSAMQIQDLLSDRALLTNRSLTTLEVDSVLADWCPVRKDMDVFWQHHPLLSRFVWRNHGTAIDLDLTHVPHHLQHLDLDARATEDVLQLLTTRCPQLQTLALRMGAERATWTTETLHRLLQSCPLLHRVALVTQVFEDDQALLVEWQRLSTGYETLHVTSAFEAGFMEFHPAQWSQLRGWWQRKARWSRMMLHVPSLAQWMEASQGVLVSDLALLYGFGRDPAAGLDVYPGLERLTLVDTGALDTSVKWEARKLITQNLPRATVFRMIERLPCDHVVCCGSDTPSVSQLAQRHPNLIGIHLAKGSEHLLAGITTSEPPRRCALTHPGSLSGLRELVVWNHSWQLKTWRAFVRLGGCAQLERLEGIIDVVVDDEEKKELFSVEDWADISAPDLRRFALHVKSDHRPEHLYSWSTSVQRFLDRHPRLHWLSIECPWLDWQPNTKQPWIQSSSLVSVRLVFATPSYMSARALELILRACPHIRSLVLAMVGDIDNRAVKQTWIRAPVAFRHVSVLFVHREDAYDPGVRQYGNWAMVTGGRHRLMFVSPSEFEMSQIPF
jgi:hypothetical protein